MEHTSEIFMIDDFDDEKASQNSYYAQFPASEYAWLYIVVDIRDMGLAKIGLTTRESPEKRVAQGKTYNPFLSLFTTYELSRCTFDTSKKELCDIESYIHGKSVFGDPVRHLSSSKNSEWFFIEPEEAEHQIDWILAKRGFAVDGKALWSASQKDVKYNSIAVDRMKKIKKIYRPFPDDFYRIAEASRIPFNLYKSYYSYLTDFHQRGADGKIYL